MKMSGDVGIGVRSYASTWVLRSAKMFATESQRIEDQYAGQWASPYVEEHISYTSSSIINSAVFLEAMVNELFIDALKNHGTSDEGYIAPLSERTRELMADWWEETRGRSSVLSKYQLLLSFAGHSKMNKDAEPYKSVASLIKFRNALVHYKPETIYSDMVHELERRLKGRYEENGLIPKEARDGNWWPNHALSAGGASWSHSSAERFARFLVSWAYALISCVIRPKLMLMA